MYSLHFKKTITEGATENRLGELGSLYKYYYYYYYYYRSTNGASEVYT